MSDTTVPCSADRSAAINEIDGVDFGVFGKRVGDSDELTNGGRNHENQC